MTQTSKKIPLRTIIGSYFTIFFLASLMVVRSLNLVKRSTVSASQATLEPVARAVPLATTESPRNKVTTVSLVSAQAILTPICLDPVIPLLENV